MASALGRKGLVAALGGMQCVERLSELAINLEVAARLFVDVQRLEESLVQPATLLIVATAVKLLGVLKKLHARFDDLCRDAEVLVGVGQPLSKALALSSDLVQAGADLVLWQGAVGSQVDEVGLLGVELT
ncbi:hypothetical protein ACFUIY_19475 [Streptomyces griseorubiginosus]|uniref:hypothetical protein n=1 Tax=Streptomyces griseorubiginosus TaxID=67304 RepID=UPI00363D8789